MTDQKTIAIFGAGTGLGASVAARFGREGYKVALIARGPTGLDLLKGKLAEQGIEAYSFPADLTDLAAIPSLVQRNRSATRLDRCCSLLSNFEQCLLRSGR